MKIGAALSAPIVFRRKRRRGTSTRHGFRYVLPSLLVLGFVFAYPIAMVFRYGFFAKGVLAVGSFTLLNFKILFTDNLFFFALKNNLLLYLLAVPIQILISLAIAILLFEKIRGWRLYRFFIFMPYVLSIVVAGVSFSVILQRNGVTNATLRAIGLGLLAADWLGDPKWALYGVLVVVLWKSTGFGVVVFNSRLLSMDIELIEAAEIDGAGWFQKHLRITIPTMRAVIEFYAVLSLVNMLSWLFGYVYVMTYGGPGNSTVVTEYYIYTQLFQYNQLGVASAATVFMLVFTLLLVVLQLRVTKVGR